MPHGDLLQRVSVPFCGKTGEFRNNVGKTGEFP